MSKNSRKPAVKSVAPVETAELDPIIETLDTVEKTAAAVQSAAVALEEAQQQVQVTTVALEEAQAAATVAEAEAEAAMAKLAEEKIEEDAQLVALRKQLTELRDKQVYWEKMADNDVYMLHREQQMLHNPHYSHPGWQARIKRKIRIYQYRVGQSNNKLAAVIADIASVQKQIDALVAA